MQVPDVNILVYAHREDSPGHSRHRAWLEALIGGDDSRETAQDPDAPV